MRKYWILLLAAFALGCGGNPTTTGPTKVTGNGTTTPSGLQYWDINVGTGDTAVSGEPVSVHYTGWLTNGEKFDSSVDRGQPFAFTLGAGQVIPGWDEGVKGMKVGGKRQLKIPASLGYGASGAGGVIPPNATLIFDVELLSVGK
jgi:FKBP-type peptidyl-prolyl cis-trans isomerase FkpA